MEKVTGTVSFPQLEEAVLQFWQQEQLFQRVQDMRRGSQAYVFYDGPPFANGLPHYGHILANTIKDVVPRYWTMRGYYVERRFGWDCHGLPVEYEIEKREGFKGRQDILRVGIEHFNSMCRESVMHYTRAWQRTITRLGRWVDWDNQYRTMDLQFMESVWHVCKTLAAKGLLYRGYKVVPYSPRITAVLSNFEANQNYKDVQDPAIVVKLRAADEDAYFLIWTTTPWTLVSNLALAVAPDMPLVKITDRKHNESFYLAAARLEEFYPKADDYEIEARLPGRDLVGRKYRPLYDCAAATANAFQVLAADFVSDDEGTGIVHMAAAFGEDDYRVCRANNIAIFDPLDDEGCFIASRVAPELANLYVKDADKVIIATLKKRGHIVRHDTIVHRYPFCERTDTPLIYRAVPAWYVAVEKFRDRLCAHNESINWVPAHLKHGRVGNWLQNAQDWAISRNRFWGTPLPIWTCGQENCEGRQVVGSRAELEQLSGERVSDLHKHVVDKLHIACPQCHTPMTRVEEVLDCWFESGAMPAAQQHYPFTHKTAPPPADFVAEGLDQTRGWFYTLNVLAAALFDQPAFRNVVVNGTILDAQGKKMSKRHRNYTAPDKLMDKHGSDSVRLYLLNSSLLRAEDLRFAEQGVVNTTRAILLPLWNAWSFLSTYAEAEDWQPPAVLLTTAPQSDNALDNWIVSQLQTLLQDVHIQMEAYRLNQAVPRLVEFIDLLTNWYIRLNRRRFWEGGANIDTAAFSTLYYVLLNFSKILAPFAPFISESIYRGLTAGLCDTHNSVHLCDVPRGDSALQQPQLEEQQALVRTVIELGRKLRAQCKLRTRQVLASVLVITTKQRDASAIDAFTELIAAELNVKQINFSAAEEKYVNLNIKPDLKKLGKRLGARLRLLQEKLAQANRSQTELRSFWQQVIAGKFSLDGEQLTADDFLLERKPGNDTAAASAGEVTILMDTNLTAELIAEGQAREVVNRLQKFRKECDLHVSNRIVVALQADGELAAAISTWHDYICHETLSTELKLLTASPAAHRFTQKFDIDGHALQIYILAVSAPVKGR